jgi:hypothetical protein
MARPRIIDVIDAGDRRLRNQTVNGLEGLNTTIIEVPLMSNGVGYMVDQIIQEVGGEGNSISVLRIWGHGYLDVPMQKVSAGGGDDPDAMVFEEGSDADTHWAALSPDNFEALKPTLSRLTPLFVEGARVELRACDIAKFEEGKSG